MQAIKCHIRSQSSISTPSSHLTPCKSTGKADIPVICTQSPEAPGVWICTSEADLLDCDYVLCTVRTNESCVGLIKIVIVQFLWSKEQGVIFHRETLSNRTDSNSLPHGICSCSLHCHINQRHVFWPFYKQRSQIGSNAIQKVLLVDFRTAFQKNNGGYKHLTISGNLILSL